MNLRVKNVSKLVRSIAILIGIIICISIFASGKSLSHEETKYKTIYVANGDTLWSIAKTEKQDNPYFENKDIRDIVNDIKSTNKLDISDLSISQELVIPYI